MLILSAAMLLTASVGVRAQGPPQPSQINGKNEIINEVSIDQKLNEQVPLDLEFRDESGRTVKLAEYFDKPVVLTLAYYECPMLCTQVLNGLVGAMKVLAFQPGQEFDIVTVSIDPTETPELAATKKREYLKRYNRAGAEKGWHFLTGSEASIKRLASAVGFRYVYDSVSRQYAHASGIMVLTPKGKVSAYQYGIEYSPKDLRLSLVEASQEKIGSLADKVLLLCYQYDPMTGKYGLVIRNAIRIGAALVALLVAGYVGISLWRERRRRRLGLDPQLTALPREARN